MKKFYVTKKSVKEYIERKTTELGLSDIKLLQLVNKELIELEPYPQENKAQIKFFRKVEDTIHINLGLKPTVSK